MGSSILERIKISSCVKESIEETYRDRMSDIITSAIRRYVSETIPPDDLSFDSLMQNIALKEVIGYVQSLKVPLTSIRDKHIDQFLDEYTKREEERYEKDVLPGARFIVNNYLTGCLDKSKRESDVHRPLRRFNGKTLREIVEYMDTLNTRDELNRDTVLEIFTIPPAVIPASNLTEESSYEVFGNKNLLDMILNYMYPDDIARLSMVSRFFWTNLRTKHKEYIELAVKLNRNGWRYECYIRATLRCVHHYYSYIKDPYLWACINLKDYRSRNIRELLSANQVSITSSMLYDYSRDYYRANGSICYIPLQLSRSLLEEDRVDKEFMKIHGKKIFKHLFDIPKHDMTHFRETLKSWTTEKISAMLNDKAFLHGLKLYQKEKFLGAIGRMYRLAPECANNPKTVELTSSFGYILPKQRF